MTKCCCMKKSKHYFALFLSLFLLLTLPSCLFRPEDGYSIPFNSSESQISVISSSENFSSSFIQSSSDESSVEISSEEVLTSEYSYITISSELSSELISSEEIISEELSFEELSSEELSSEEPSSEELSSEVSSFEELSSDEPSSEELSSQEPSSEELSNEEISSNESSSEELSSEELSSDEPSSEELSSEEPSSEELSSEEWSSEELSSDEPSSEELSSQELSSEELSSEETSSEELSSEELSSEEISSEEPSSEEISSEEVSSKEPSSEEISSEEISSEELSSEEISSEIPSSSEYSSEILSSEEVTTSEESSAEISSEESSIEYSSEEISSIEISSEEPSSSEPQTYVVTWKDDEGNVLKVDDDLLFGDYPYYGDIDPTKPSTVQYDYTFAGWNPEVDFVTDNITYEAIFNATIRKYNVTWLNDDNSTLRVDKVKYGDTPSYGTNPTKASTAQYSYTFLSWDKKVVAVTGDVTYKAVYSSSVMTYTITWKNYDGSVILKNTFSYGSDPLYTGDTPERAADSSYTYTFSSWTPSLKTVTQNATYQATYTKEAIITASFPSTIYFSDALNWGNIYAYAWGGTGTTMTWPGVKMNYHRTNDYGQKVYSISNMENYKYVIFTTANATKYQTVDIPCTELGTNNAYYTNSSKDNKGHYTVGTWLETESAEVAPVSGLKILQCFDWSLATIKANLGDIAYQGFNAIQTSPLQAAKDYSTAYQDRNDTWWRYYQPVSLSLGNKNNNGLFTTTNGDNELKELTAAASAKGIRVIVDVVVNHLGDGSGNGGLHYSVSYYESYIYNNTSTTLHNWGYNDDNYVKNIVYGNVTGVDLNTGNSHVQDRVCAYLKQLIDDGVAGFRFDAAKHIETPNEQDGCASSFWTNTLGVARSYAASKGLSIFAYGEILNPAGNTGKRSYEQYISSAKLDAVTDSIIGEKYRAGDTSSGYWTGVSAEHNVVWAESHDDYLGSAHVTTNIGQDVINNAYDKLARNTSGSNLLYFARPDTNAYIGGLDAHPDWGWRSNYIRDANLAHS